MRALLLICLGLLSACQSLAPIPAWQSPQGRDDPQLGQIIESSTGARLTPAQLVDRLGGADRVLVGEQHDNPDHHALELWLLQALASRRAQGSVLLEMLEPAQQANVDAARQQVAEGTPPKDLPNALAWQKGWDWAGYGPLVRYALAQPYPLLAANLDRSEIMGIYRAVPSLSGSASTAPAVREPLLEQIRQSHCGLLPESQLPAMLAVQQQRDRRIAERLRDAPLPALLFTGAYHARRDLGVPLHLTDLGVRDARVLLLVEVGQQVAPGSADFVWYTAAQPEQDHCAELRR